jgi:hypothetical protein
MNMMCNEIQLYFMFNDFRGCLPTSDTHPPPQSISLIILPLDCGGITSTTIPDLE